MYVCVCVYMYRYTYIHIYTHTHIYKYTHEHTDTYIQIHMHNRIAPKHTKLIFSLFTHYVGLFSFGSTKLRKIISSSKTIFILNTQCCNIIILMSLHMTATKYENIKAIFLFVEICYNNRKHHQTFS